ncbi:hypothetical protein DQG13_11510 [Paenibacillus sp. YN15]|nr:hypothetical protein DQG13_11510 [Paenibacillus sp. YN15]
MKPERCFTAAAISCPVAGTGTGTSAGAGTSADTGTSAGTGTEHGWMPQPHCAVNLRVRFTLPLLVSSCHGFPKTSRRTFFRRVFLECCRSRPMDRLGTGDAPLFPPSEKGIASASGNGYNSLVNACSRKGLFSTCAVRTLPGWRVFPEAPFPG